MKRTILIILSLLLCLLIGHQVYSQVEIKGAGSTSSTFTLITKNSTPDTSFVVKDNGNVGIGTVNPGYDLEVTGQLGVDTIVFANGTIQTTSARYARVFTVATSGGDFQNLQAALANVTLLNPSPTNQFLIQVMPGNYATQGGGVICLEYVHLRGSGKYSCTINDPVVGADSCVIEDFYLAQGVVCNGTNPTILHNIITDTTTDNSDGIYISNDAHPWIKENEILDCNGFGINCDGFGCDAWIIANKIHRNEGGGIRCEDSSPTISNNLITWNFNFGIWMMGAPGTPAEPTIDDNVIGHTEYNSGGIGIFIAGRAEPRIIANDIYLNETAIQIHPATQPSILSNNINYNRRFGIETMSNGATKPVVIQGNHIHSSAVSAVPPSAGIWIAGNSSPVIAQNVVINNDPAGINADIDYTANAPATPVLNMNVYNIINRWFVPPPWLGTGQYNATSAGGTINP